VKAAEFYEHFERAFVAASSHVGLRRLKGAQPKWTTPAIDGAVSLKFSTNPKASGLLPLSWPGEFRPLFRWRHSSTGGKVEEDVSFFQYADESTVDDAVALQRAAIGKYFRNRYDAVEEREQWIAKYDPFHRPLPNIEQWFYYFDASDAASWGQYFGGFIGSWLHNFNQHPESRHEWCRRVLWKDLPRKTP